MTELQRCVQCEWNTIDIDKQRNAIRILTAQVQTQQEQINMLLRVAGMAELERRE